MRTWNLGLGDPLALTLGADFRHCTPDYANDHIWELEPGGGEPPALGLRTTYGLRARAMRIFPRFHHNAQVLSDPLAFTQPPILQRFSPSHLRLHFAPFTGIEVSTEYWIPDSHTAAGRFTFSNTRGETAPVQFELCAQLAPLEAGQPLVSTSMQLAQVLAGRSADLFPVLFLTGGPLPGAGPYPSLVINLALAAGGKRILTWVQAALDTVEKSFEHARLTAARPWDAEIARVELVHDAQTVEVRTGDPDWDAAFALSQKNAFSLFFPASPHLPCPSFVLSRQPDQGFSPRGDGSDHGYMWSGQSALEAGYLASCLPGAPDILPGLVRNFLAAQAEDGSIDWKPGIAGQRGRWQSAPLLAGLAQEAANRSRQAGFLAEAFPPLLAFLRRWLEADHDRDGDGFPEWDHPLQSGMEDHPLFSAWQDGQAGDITCAESPALAAMLCREFRLLAQTASQLGMPETAEELLMLAARQQHLVEACWDPAAGRYHLRDRDSHRSPSGELLASRSGTGTLDIRHSFKFPTRLLVRVHFKAGLARQPRLTLRGRLSRQAQSETLERADFTWGEGRATATTRGLFTSILSLQIEGLEKRDQVSLQVMDFSSQEISLFLPLWAQVPNPPRAAQLVSQNLCNPQRFWQSFGIPIQPCADGQVDPPSSRQAVHLHWNALIGQGLLAYGFRAQAAELTGRLMSAVILNLKRQRAFYRTYHARTGAGLGERNALQGLAPLGLFLETLGVVSLAPGEVTLCGKNPFPWPVTVKYRGLTVTRTQDRTTVVFPGGQEITLDDPTEAVVTATQEA